VSESRSDEWCVLLIKNQFLKNLLFLNFPKKRFLFLKSFNAIHWLELFADGPVSLKILDANGEEVSTIDYQKGFTGINSVAWDGSKMSSGRYMIRIEQNGAVSGHFAVLR
jgi:hypothetical protein